MTKSINNDVYAYCPNGYEELWRKEENQTNGLEKFDKRMKGSNNYSMEAKIVRDHFKDYFLSSEGSVEWQIEVCTSTKNSFDGY